MHLPKILVIIPAYNEGGSIGKVVTAIKKVQIQCDIVVINDGSMDDTGIVARKAGAKVIDLPYNLGIGGAMQTGYLYAKRRGYDIAVQVDGDGQHNPSDLSLVLASVISGEADLAIGSRYLKKTKYQSPVLRRLGMLVLAATVSRITRQRFFDTTSGFRAAGRKVIAYFAHYYPVDYPEVESLVLLKRVGFKVQEICVNMEQRVSGRSSITSWHTIYYMLKVMFALGVNLLHKPKREGHTL